MTIWQFIAARDGYIRANSPQSPGPPSNTPPATQGGGGGLTREKFREWQQRVKEHGTINV